MSDVKSVTVFCSSSKRVPRLYLDAAGELGRAVAEAGWTLVYGGNDAGCMGMAARGARSCGGKVVGISPQVFVDKGVIDHLCDELIITPDMRRRKELMEQCGEAFIAFPGGIGTFEELFEVLVGKQIGLHNKPIVVLNLQGYFNPFLDVLDHGLELGFIRRGTKEQVFLADTIERAIEHLRNYTPSAVVPIELQRPEEISGGLEG
jgi:cytokinin riboside 5'-monophosphate phosphoribohydrolase